MQQSLLERLFSIKEKGSTTKTEIIAGITTFFTMVYIVFVNPSVLGDAGMDKQVVFVTTCLIAALGTIAMGLFSNLPIYNHFGQTSFINKQTHRDNGESGVFRPSFQFIQLLFAQ